MVLSDFGAKFMDYLRFYDKASYIALYEKTDLAGCNPGYPLFLPEK